MTAALRLLQPPDEQEDEARQANKQEEEIARAFKAPAEDWRLVDTRNARDLENNPIVRFQHDHYLAIALAMNFGVTLLLGYLHGDVWGMLLLAGFLRIVVSHHCTFFINSLAHFWGRRPYTTENTARDNDLLAFFTYGEGYHNYHHLFQWDYRNGIRWWQYDPTKWVIASASFLGFARSLKRVPEAQIRQALVERQLEVAKERIANCQEPSRLAEPTALPRASAFVGRPCSERRASSPPARHLSRQR